MRQIYAECPHCHNGGPHLVYKEDLEGAPTEVEAECGNCGRLFMAPLGGQS